MRAQIEKFSKDAKEQIDSKDYKAALEIYENAEPLISTGGTKEEFAVLHHNMATCYKHLNELLKAYEYYVKARGMAKKIEDPVKQEERVEKEESCIQLVVPKIFEDDSIYAGIGLDFLSREMSRFQDENADKLSKKTLVGLFESSKRLEYLSYLQTKCSEFIGMNSARITQLTKLDIEAGKKMNLGEYAAALEIYKNAESLMLAASTREGLAILNHNMAACYRHLNKLIHAYEYYVKALELTKEINDPATRKERAEEEESYIQKVVHQILEDESVDSELRYEFSEREKIRFLTKILQQPISGRDFDLALRKINRQEEYINYLDGKRGELKSIVDSGVRNTR